MGKKLNIDKTVFFIFFIYTKRSLWFSVVFTQEESLFFFFNYSFLFTQKHSVDKKQIKHRVGDGERHTT